MIEVNNIKKSFSGTEILKGISASFEPGKTHLIIGRSGSGKTVLIKSILGLHEVNSGEIRFDGQLFGDMNKNQRISLRQEIGMVFQGGALFDSMTVEENIMFPMNMFTEQTPQEKLDRVNFCLERVNLPGSNGKLPSELSGGMQKRVAIARAIALNPKYLFCDEPNSGLDPDTSIVIDQLIKEITEEFGITTIINTHDMNSVLEIGEHILFLKDGNLKWEGTKEEVLSTRNKDVEEFVFRSKLFKKVREALI